MDLYFRAQEWNMASLGGLSFDLWLVDWWEVDEEAFWLAKSCNNLHQGIECRHATMLEF